jgi:hypothetical protein
LYGIKIVFLNLYSSDVSDYVLVHNATAGPCMFRRGIPTEVGNVSIFIHKKSEGNRPYRDRHVQVPVRTGRKNMGIYPVSSPSDIGFIQFMKKIVKFNSTHPPITHIGVHSGLKKTNSTYPRPPKKGRIPALVAGRYFPLYTI